MAAGDDTPRPISLFYSYSHRNERYREKLETQLKILQRQGVIDGWHDRKIGAGKDWTSEIDHHLESAGIILLLVSDNFLASDYCYGKEMTRALERHESGSARVIPIILSHCLWEEAPFAKLQALPRDAKPITRWNDRTEAYKSVAVGIRYAARELRAAAAPHSTPLPGGEGASDPHPTPLPKNDLADDTGLPPELLRPPVNIDEVLAKLGYSSPQRSGSSPPPLRRPHPDPLPVGEGASRPHPDPLPQAGEGGTRRSGRVRAFEDLEVFRDVDAPWCPEMVVIPKGTFLMGSPESERGHTDAEGPQHTVTIGHRFAIGRFPVTFLEYCHFDFVKRHQYYNDWEKRIPIWGITWYEARKYAEWLSEETGNLYRLPSEAEWEYACRAGTTSRYAFGDSIDGSLANCSQTNPIWTEVDRYPANPWGLYDMHGDREEWLEDVWHDTYEGAPKDGSAWLVGEGSSPHQDRVARGLSWESGPLGCRSAARAMRPPHIRGDIGFRVARTLD